jgi:hypothetical protein
MIKIHIQVSGPTKCGKSRLIAAMEEAALKVPHIIQPIDVTYEELTVKKIVNN